MKRKGLRFLCAMLCAALLCPLLASVQIAAEDSTEPKRFIFSALHSQSQTAYVTTANAPVSLSLSENESSFEAEVVTPVGDREINALYVSLRNDANAAAMEIVYSFSSNQSVTTKTLSHELTAAQNTFVLPLHASLAAEDLISLTLRFLPADGELSGTVTLQSFYDLSVYTPEAKEGATFTECRYDRETNTIKVSGVLEYASSYTKLELYMLGPGEEIHQHYGRPVASIPISTRFSFSVSIGYTEEIYSRYVLAAVTNKGARTQLCAPIYPDIPATALVQNDGFKGFHTASLYDVIDSGAKLEIVDVYLDRLQSDRETGILYTGAHSYYYFNESYIQSLDTRIRNLSGVGCAVYLRFLVSADATDSVAETNDYPYVTDHVEGIAYKGISINSQADLYTINAFTDFLTARYSTVQNGRISGIIMGSRADRAAIYGYVGPMTLAEYAEHYAMALNVVAGTARNNVPELQIVVPLSDRVWPETVSAENLSGDYFSELFLLSLLEAMQASALNPHAFSVMVESDTIPERVGEQQDGYYGTDQLDTLLQLLTRYGEYYDFLDTGILYAWSPEASLSDASLRAAFAIQYLTLFFNNRVRGFFVDLSRLDESGAEKVIEATKYLITNIDTEQGDAVLRLALAEANVSDPTDIFSGYTAGRLRQRKVVSLTMGTQGYAGNDAVLGRYELWNFSKSTDLLGWYQGYCCEVPSVTGRALTAVMRAEEGSYAELAYHFDGVTDYSFAPLMRFLLSVNGEEGVPYEICIRLLGDGVDIRSSVVTTAGDTKELYLDLRAYRTDLSALRGIRVMVRPLNGSDTVYTLRLHSAYLESAELDDAALAERVAAGRTDQSTPETEAVTRDLKAPILITLAIVALSALITTGVVLGHRKRARKKSENKQERSAS